MSQRGKFAFSFAEVEFGFLMNDLEVRIDCGAMVNGALHIVWSVDGKVAFFCMF